MGIFGTTSTVESRCSFFLRWLSWQLSLRLAENQFIAGVLSTLQVHNIHSIYRFKCNVCCWIWQICFQILFTSVDSQVGYANSFCWVRNTYYLSFEEDILPSDQEKQYLRYYQWVKTKPGSLLSLLLLRFNEAALVCKCWEILAGALHSLGASHLVLPPISVLEEFQRERRNLHRINSDEQPQVEFVQRRCESPGNPCFRCDTTWQVTSLVYRFSASYRCIASLFVRVNKTAINVLELLN